MPNEEWRRIEDPNYEDIDNDIGIFGTSKGATEIALIQIDSVISTIKGNKWEKAMEGPLYTVKYELERQLSFLQ